MITPTPGRVVWYNPKPQDNLEQINGAPLAAIIVGVHSDTDINLVTFSAYGNYRAFRHVTLWGSGEEGDRSQGGFAEWMPYQLGQAAKTEELLQTVKTSTIND